MREIVLDTETTGLDPFQGDRLVEIGCIELVNRIPTGQTLPPLSQSGTRHAEPRPSRSTASSSSSSRTSRCSPRSSTNFVEFIGDAPLVAHNAMFDLGFLNAELERARRPAVARERLVDTLLLARRSTRPGRTASTICARAIGIDNSRRTKHGALLDAEILAEVYVELIGARQAQLGLVETGNGATGQC